MSEGSKPVCPRCQSALIAQIANARHCNACGLDFGLVKDPIGERARSPEKRGLWTSKPANTASGKK